MSAWTCAICAARNLGSAPRCIACGQDPHDPAIAALAALAPAGGAGTADGAPSSPDQVLGGGRVFGLDEPGLRDGGAFRRLGGLGGLVLLIVFVIPATKGNGGHRFAWELFQTGPKLALLLPLPLGLLGLVLGLVPGLPGIARALGLAVAGLVLLTLSVPDHGALALAGRLLEPVLLAGTLLLGAALIARVLAPFARPPRIAALVGAALAIVGLWIPYGDLAQHVPAELPWYARLLPIPLEDASIARALWGGLDRTAGPVFFLALFGLLPLLLWPAAAALAWPRVTATWDRRGRLLVPLAWVLAPGLALWLVLVAWNAVGWGTSEAEALLLARARLAAIAWIAVAWVVAPLARALLGRGAPATTSGTSRDPARTA